MIKIITPFSILFALLTLFFYELYFSKPRELPLTLTNETISEFNLPNLFDKEPSFTKKDLKGRVILLNVWASWCHACKKEHSMLMKIKNTYHIPIYAIDYKDNQENALDWLNQKGNPYVMVGVDKKGEVAIDLGVYGTPETFVINSQGKIIYRYIGAINQKIWDEVFYPLIKTNEV